MGAFLSTMSIKMVVKLDERVRMQLGTLFTLQS